MSARAVAKKDRGEPPYYKGQGKGQDELSRVNEACGDVSRANAGRGTKWGRNVDCDPISQQSVVL